MINTFKALKMNLSNDRIFWILIYFLLLVYSLVAIVNLFTPIYQYTGIVIIILSYITSLHLSKCSSCKYISTNKNNYVFSSRWAIVIASIFSLVLIVLASSRQTTGIDSNLYHLPMARLLNVSVWYPGIANLNSHYGFLNGTAIGASAFSSLGWPGAANIYTSLFWIMFAIGLVKALNDNLPMWLSFVTAAGVLGHLTFSGQAYNMGTDLPQGALIFLGMWFLLKGSKGNAAVLLAFAACFKPIGQFAYFLCFIYIAISNRKLLLSRMLVMSYVIIAISLLRVFIGTGSPLYPSPFVLFQIPEWGIDSTEITGLAFSLLNNRPSVALTLPEIANFLVRFFATPKTVFSGYWFSPCISILILYTMIYLLKKDKRRKLLSSLTKPVTATLTILFLLFFFWIATKPMFRVGAGLWVFAYVFLLRVIWAISGTNAKRIIAAVVIIVSLVFIGHGSIWAYRNLLGNPIRGDQPQYTVASYVFQFLANVDTQNPYSGSLELRRTQEGYCYLITNSTYIGTWPQPIITCRSLGDNDEFIRKFYQNNPNHAPNFESIIHNEQQAGMPNAVINVE